MIDLNHIVHHVHFAPWSPNALWSNILSDPYCLHFFGRPIQYTYFESLVRCYIDHIGNFQTHLLYPYASEPDHRTLLGYQLYMEWHKKSDALFLKNGPHYCLDDVDRSYHTATDRAISVCSTSHNNILQTRTFPTLRALKRFKQHVAVPMLLLSNKYALIYA